MTNCKELHNPLPSKLQDSTETPTPLADPLSYRKTVGALQYLTVTRPDLQFAVNLLCQHLHHPTTVHYQLLKRVLRYLKGSLHFQLPIQPTDLQLVSYADANWANDPIDRRSTTGHCSFLGSTLISWQVKKQPTVAKSSTEAEYRSLAIAAADIIWLRRLLQDFQVPCSSPTILHCDKVSAIALANNTVFHARTKHVEIDYHFIRERIQSKEIAVIHLHSQDQIADIFTKQLSTARFQYLRSKLTLTSPSVNLRGGNSGNDTCGTSSTPMISNHNRTSENIKASTIS